MATSSCLCQQWQPLATKTRISALLHAAEVSKPSNTARLLQLWLPNVQLMVQGSAQDPKGFRQRRQLAELPASTAILFPSADALPIAHFAPAGRPLSLLVPDGTWAQARRMVRRALLPLGLPFVRLPDGLPSAYTLRRNSTGRVCTLEAVAWALASLGEPKVSAHLLRRFEHWAALQAALRGGAVRGRLSQPR